MESSVTFDAQGIWLEGRLYEGHRQKGAIITHPHPLYGGDMDNAVVAALAHAYQEANWSTLRFNFRGTGHSKGTYDDGNGEQDDIQAAVDFLLAQGVHQIQLAGYSFGAWVLARWSQQFNQKGYPLFLISPPVAFIEFPTGALPGLKEVFTGHRDDLAPPAQIRSHLPQWQPEVTLTIIEKTDHFFWNQMGELTERFSRGIERYDAVALNSDPVLTKAENDGQ